MLKRRVRRVVLSGFLLAVAVSGLTACRTSPNVAAYVGDTRITVAELQSAVEDRQADPDVAAFAEADPDAFTRRVLTLLVQEEVYAAAAERYDVQISDDDVRARIDQLLGNDDPGAVFGQLAQQGIGSEDVVENVRQQLVRQEIADAAGQAQTESDAELRARYDAVRESLAEISFGYITVPDEATAQAVQAQLTADPASYSAVAARYAGDSTLPALVTAPAGELPAVLADGIAAAAPNTAFLTPVPQAGGIVVTFVEGAVYPEFEEVRPQLAAEADRATDAAGSALVEEVREDLEVTVNPRYGVLEQGQLVPADGGVVDILGDDAEGGSAPAE